MWLLSQAWLTGTAIVNGAVREAACLAGVGGSSTVLCVSVSLASMGLEHVLVNRIAMLPYCTASCTTVTFLASVYQWLHDCTVQVQCCTIGQACHILTS
jgi:hypothetical protein